jgi:Na+/glutamate symporter
MDNNENRNETEDFEFAKEIGKAFVFSAAATAGTVAGFVLVGTVMHKLSERKARKQAKKNPTTEEN